MALSIVYARWILQFLQWKAPIKVFICNDCPINRLHQFSSIDLLVGAPFNITLLDLVWIYCFRVLTHLSDTERHNVHKDAIAYRSIDVVPLQRLCWPTLRHTGNHEMNRFSQDNYTTPSFLFSSPPRSFCFFASPLTHHVKQLYTGNQYYSAT